MSTNDVRLTYIADVSAAIAGMTSVQAATKAQINEVNRASAALKAYDKAQAALGSTTQAATRDWSQFRQIQKYLPVQIMDVVQSIQAGQNPMRAMTAQAMDVGGQLVSAANSAGLLTSALNIVGPATALVTTAAIAGYGAWRIYTMEEDAAEAAAARLKITLEDMAPTAKRVASARLEADRATGRLTAAEYGYTRAVQSAKDARDAQVAAIIKESGLTEQQVKNNQMLLTGTGEYSQALGQLKPELLSTLVSIAAVNTGYEQEVAALAETKTANERAAAAKRTHREEIKKLTDAQQADAALRAELYQIEAADIDRQKAEHQAAADAEIEDQRRIIDGRIAAAEQKRQLVEQEIADAKRLHEEQVGYAYDTVGALGQAADTIAQQGGQAAAAAAIASKGAAIFQIGVDTAASIVKGMALFGPPPSPAGIAAIAAAASIGGIQAGLVAAEPLPEYHVGGVVRAELLPGEAVLNRSATESLGESGVAALNRGEAPATAGGNITIVQKYKHRVFDRIAADSLRLPNSSLGKRLRALAPPIGHRT